MLVLKSRHTLSDTLASEFQQQSRREHSSDFTGYLPDQAVCIRHIQDGAESTEIENP